MRVPMNSAWPASSLSFICYLKAYAHQDLSANPFQIPFLHHSTYVWIFYKKKTKTMGTVLSCQQQKKSVTVFFCFSTSQTYTKQYKRTSQLTAVAWLHTGCIQLSGLCVGDTYFLFKSSSVIGITFNSKCGKTNIHFSVIDIYRCFCNAAGGLRNFLDKQKLSGCMSISLAVANCLDWTA